MALALEFLVLLPLDRGAGFKLLVCFKSVCRFHGLARTLWVCLSFATIFNSRGLCFWMSDTSGSVHVRVNFNCKSIAHGNYFSVFNLDSVSYLDGLYVGLVVWTNLRNRRRATHV